MTTILILCIIMSTAFALCYKIAAQKKCDLHAVNAWMYTGATVSMLAVILIKGHFEYNTTTLILGLSGGLLSFIATLTFFLHIKEGQLSASWTVISLSMAFPITASIVIWHEHPSLKQAIGLVLIIIALILFGRKELKNTEADK